MKKLFSLLFRWSNVVGYPVYLLIPYAPGAILSAILIPNPFGRWMYLALLVAELWELKMLHDLGNFLTLFFGSTILLHPNLCAFTHIVNRILMHLHLNIFIPFSDDMLLRLRAWYVVAAFVSITIYWIYHKNRSRVMK